MRTRKSKRTMIKTFLSSLLLFSCICLFGCGGITESSGSKGENVITETNQPETPSVSPSTEDIGTKDIQTSFSLDEIPDYSGDPYVMIHDNKPDFTDEDRNASPYESYSELDALGRCGTAMAYIGKELMPSEKRGNISHIKPSGWKSVRYDNVEGRSLYNRCHLIGFQLTGENANEKNLITGTRYMNVEGMLPFEDLAADYVRDTGNHVLYRVTPVFEGNNLVASGVQMEAESIEDHGKSVCYNVYVYNVQPGIEIDYATGESRQVNTENTSSKTEEESYILNTGTKKFHKPSCSSTEDMKPSNRETYTGSRENLISQGYEPCGRCKP